MKLLAFATLVAVLGISVGSASAQVSIGVFSDPGSASCNITAPLGVPTTFYINVVGAGALVPTGIFGAEFAVLHSIDIGRSRVVRMVNRSICTRSL